MDEEKIGWPLALLIAGASVSGALELVIHFTGDAALVLPELRFGFGLFLWSFLRGESKRWGIFPEKGPASAWTVYFWIAAYFALVWAMKLRPNAYFPPRGLARFGLELAAVFVLTLASALIKESRQAPGLPAPGPAPEPQPADQKARILAYCREHDGKISTAECAQELKLSHRQARRVLSELEKQGLLVRVGGLGDRQTSYKLP